MNNRIYTCLVVFLLIASLTFGQSEHYKIQNGKYKLTLSGASHLAKLPLKCMQQEYPYKSGIVIADSSLVAPPKDYHPAFYGCFDWHSSVHGHWMLVRLLKLFPSLPEAAEIRQKLKENLSASNIEQETRIFRMNANKGFERTYGWGWLLQLQAELLGWKDPLGDELSKNMSPLANQISQMYIEYLPKMGYAVRVGEHTNLAFGLKLAWDYATLTKNDALLKSIRSTALRFYMKDENCPITWEPGGADFLSPCLEEADLMARILPAAEYQKWISKFLPDVSSGNFILQPAMVTDRSDGKLVHLDGLNLSRAWNLYSIAKHLTKNKESLYKIASAHLAKALPNVASGDYMGEHWLASFAVIALTAQ